MLVLKRKRSEIVVVTGPDGTETLVMLVDVDHNSVRLGFLAPPGVMIDRLEIHEAKQLNRKETTDAES